MSPVISQVVAGAIAVQVSPPGLEVTVYEVGAPPLEGGSQLMIALPSPAVPVGGPGTPGSASGETELLDGEALDVPPLFVAVTENVWPVPLFRPVTSHVTAGAVAVQVCPPGLAVTV